MNKLYYHNGQKWSNEIPLVPVDNQGLQYAGGGFTGQGFYLDHKNPDLAHTLLWDTHFERHWNLLEKTFGVPLAEKVSHLETMTETLIEGIKQNMPFLQDNTDLAKLYLRFFTYNSKQSLGPQHYGAPINTIFYPTPVERKDLKWHDRHVVLDLSGETIPYLGGFDPTQKKSANYGIFTALTAEAARHGYQDFIRIDPKGNLTEHNSSGLLFITKDGRIMTPDISSGNALQSITRMAILGGEIPGLTGEQMGIAEYLRINTEIIPMNAKNWGDYADDIAGVLSAGTYAQIKPATKFTVIGLDGKPQTMDFSDNHQANEITQKLSETYTLMHRGGIPEFQHWLLTVEK